MCCSSVQGKNRLHWSNQHVDSWKCSHVSLQCLEGMDSVFINFSISIRIWSDNSWSTLKYSNFQSQSFLECRDSIFRILHLAYSESYHYHPKLSHSAMFLGSRAILSSFSTRVSQRFWSHRCGDKTMRHSWPDQLSPSARPMVRGNHEWMTRSHTALCCE